jgi:hypothetical protein
MNPTPSDAMVFFGATGNLAYKKIFPSLQAMLKRGRLDVPVIGVAKAGWNLGQLKARAKESLEKHGGLDQAALEKLTGLSRAPGGLPRPGRKPRPRGGLARSGRSARQGGDPLIKDAARVAIPSCDSNRHQLPLIQSL